MKAEETALYRICECARLYPDRIAYRDDQTEYTYSECMERCEKIAGSLCGADAPVICYGERGADMLCAMFGCYIAKRAYVPVQAGTPSERIASIVSITKADKVLCSCGGGSFANADVCSIGEIVKSDITPQRADFSDFDENRIVYMIFTSGSTGIPKGVPINERNLASFVGWIGNIYSKEKYAHINVLGTASFSFDLSVADIYFSLCFGNTLVSLGKCDKGNSETICDKFIGYGIDVAVVTPTFARLCLLGGKFNTESIPKLKSIFLCGEVLDKKTANRLLTNFPNLSLINAYGPTEATCAVSAAKINKEHIACNLSLPVGSTETCACNLEISDGKIILKGNSVFSGYLGGIPGGHFTKNGTNCYDTGDLGFIKNGLIYCNGRNDGQIKFRGYRIELSEIESVISEIDGIQSCAVIAKRTADGTVRSIRAFVCPENDNVTEEIIGRLSLKIPDYMLPRIKLMQELPVNANGKIDRKKLCEM